MTPIIFKPIVIDMEKLLAEKRAKRRLLTSVKRYPLQPHQIAAYYGLPEPGESCEDSCEEESDEALNQKEKNEALMELDEAEDIPLATKTTKEASNKETPKRQPAKSKVKPAETVTKQRLRNKKEVDSKDIGEAPMELDQAVDIQPSTKNAKEPSNKGTRKRQSAKSIVKTAEPVTMQHHRSNKEVDSIDIGEAPIKAGQKKRSKTPFPPALKKTTDASSEATQKHRQTKSTKRSDSESANPATKQPVRRSERLASQPRINYSEGRKPRLVNPQNIEDKINATIAPKR